MDKTILYYTSNREDPTFEQKIIDDLLLKSGNLPIISVSQKPMTLGKNICVGDIGFSYLSEYKQMLAGAKLAETDYIITAESDFLYPPEYFQLKPEGEDIYRYDKIWVLSLLNKDGFWQKGRTSEGAQLVKRDYFIKILEKYVNRPDPNHSPYFRQPWHYLVGKIPCVTIKTGNGMNLRTRAVGKAEKRLPYWGESDKLIEKLS